MPSSSLVPLMQGMGQMTPAQRQIISKVYGRAGGVRSAAKRRKKKAAGARGASRKVSIRRVAKSARRLVKGSAAAKAYMAKIRKRRKK